MTRAEALTRRLYADPRWPKRYRANVRAFSVQVGMPERSTRYSQRQVGTVWSSEGLPMKLHHLHFLGMRRPGFVAMRLAAHYAGYREAEAELETKVRLRPLTEQEERRMALRLLETT